MVLEKNCFKFRQCNISSLERAWFFIWTNLNSLLPKDASATFGWSSPSNSGDEYKNVDIWNYRHTDKRLEKLSWVFRSSEGKTWTLSCLTNLVDIIVSKNITSCLYRCISIKLRSRILTFMDFTYAWPCRFQIAIGRYFSQVIPLVTRCWSIIFTGRKIYAGRGRGSML